MIDQSTANPGSSVSERLIDASGVQLDRLPMLPIVFDRVANTFGDSLRSVAASPCYVTMSHMDEGKIADLMEPYEADAVCAILDVPEWDTQVVVGFDRDSIFTLAEVVFGADGSEPPEEDGRAFSNIEMRLCHKLAEILCGVLSQAFGVATKASFHIERLETRMHFAVVGRRSAPAAAAKFLVQAINRGGEIFVVLPQPALQTMRQSLSSMTGQETGQRDKDWTRRMREGVTRADITISAILNDLTMTLGEVAALKPGQVLELDATPKTPVRLTANDQSLFWCQLGQADGAYRLRIDTVFDPQQELLSDLINH